MKFDLLSSPIKDQKFESAKNQDYYVGKVIRYVTIICPCDELTWVSTQSSPLSTDLLFNFYGLKFEKNARLQE